MGHVFDGGEVGRRVIDSDAALVVAEEQSMSITQCRLFSIAQWLRTAGPSRAATLAGEVI
jgi:hypothetical protein